MHSRSWIVAASSVAFMSACGSNHLSEDTGRSEAQLEGAASELAAGPAADLSDPAFADTSRLAHTPSQRLATGQWITPTALRGAVQQVLNPGLANYPNFIAGEAVRSQLSPDGATLAVLCAGQNSLYAPDGTVDTANSTQYIFLYDVNGPNKRSPVLKQVLKPVNS
ncbi:MAG TPA: hypothetical protein VLJ38_16805, partial [Polyangiaceae bacterium]|nr:hypothetical protein [Polyangiaceae bacterium]